MRETSREISWGMARFYNVLLRTLFHGLDRRIHGGVSGDDDGRSLWPKAVNFHIVSMPSIPPGIFRSMKALIIILSDAALGPFARPARRRVNAITVLRVTTLPSIRT